MHEVARPGTSRSHCNLGQPIQLEVSALEQVHEKHFDVGGQALHTSFAALMCSKSCWSSFWKSAVDCFSFSLLQNQTMKPVAQGQLGQICLPCWFLGQSVRLLGLSTLTRMSRFARSISPSRLLFDTLARAGWSGRSGPMKPYVGFAIFHSASIPVRPKWCRRSMESVSRTMLGELEHISPFARSTVPCILATQPTAVAPPRLRLHCAGDSTNQLWVSGMVNGQSAVKAVELLASKMNPTTRKEEPLATSHSPRSLRCRRVGLMMSTVDHLVKDNEVEAAHGCPRATHATAGWQNPGGVAVRQSTCTSGSRACQGQSYCQACGYRAYPLRNVGNPTTKEGEVLPSSSSQVAQSQDLKYIDQDISL